MDSKGGRKLSQEAVLILDSPGSGTGPEVAFDIEVSFQDENRSGSIDGGGSELQNMLLSGEDITSGKSEKNHSDFINVSFIIFLGYCSFFLFFFFFPPPPPPLLGVIC